MFAATKNPTHLFRSLRNNCYQHAQRIDCHIVPCCYLCMRRDVFVAAVHRHGSGEQHRAAKAEEQLREFVYPVQAVAGFINSILPPDGDFPFRNPTVDIPVVSIATFILIIVGVVAGAIPAVRAMRIKPIEALNYEK